MPNTREKLIELVKCVDFHPCKGAVATIGSKFNTEFIEAIADHLQAHIVEEEYHFTNADRIRAMSDEELAKFCNSGFHCIICSEGNKGEKDVCDVKCDEHCLEWLQQPAEEATP